MKSFLFSIPGSIAIIGIILLTIFGAGLGFNSNALTGSSGTREIMQIVISVVILGASLYIILSKKYPADVQKWAYGAIGTVIGFWLPSAA